VMSVISPRLDPTPASPQSQGWILFFGVFLVAGMALGKLARMALDDAIGNEAGIADRLGGSALGAVRVGMVATSLVLVFDQLLPPNRQPAFLNGSQFRPLFSAAGQMGFRSLPPDVAATIDRLKKDRHI
jgi:membrane protein required for colicin V production